MQVIGEAVVCYIHIQIMSTDKIDNLQLRSDSFVGFLIVLTVSCLVQSYFSVSNIFVPQFSIFSDKKSFKTIIGNSVMGELGERFTVILPGYRSAQNYTWLTIGGFLEEFPESLGK